MRVTPEMLHEDLRPLFRKHSAIPLLFRRKWSVKVLDLASRVLLKSRDIDGLSCRELHIPSGDKKRKIRVRIYRPHSDKKLPAMLYFHGGGFMAGMPEISETVIKGIIDKRPCVIIAPDYRKSVKHPYPAGFNDCYETLLWSRDNAEELGIASEKYMIAGHSAGGGMAAAVVLKNRDKCDVDVAFQMPIYPMLEDRQASRSGGDMRVPVWDSRSNKFAWSLYLRDLNKKAHPIPAYAAPARSRDYRGCPPTITYVGNLEPFYEDTLDYIHSLESDGVEVTSRIFFGCYHAFDSVAPEAGVSREAREFMLDSFASYYDKYVRDFI